MKRIITVILTLILLVSVPAANADTGTYGTYEIISPENLPGLITERKLPDDEIPTDTGVGLEKLKQEISTYGDLIAWVRLALLPRLQFVCTTTSNPNGQYTHGADFAYSWLSSWFSANQTAAIAQYVLEDDYPGIGTLFLFIKMGNGLNMKCANYVPAEGGYYIINPELFIGMDKNMLMNSCALNDMLFVSDLTGVVPYWQEAVSSDKLVQVLAVDSADTVALNPGDWQYIPEDETHFITVFLDDEAKYPPASASLDFGSFGFPKQISKQSSIDAETARTLAQGSFEEAREAIKTIPDMMNYLYYSGYSQYGFDQSLDTHEGEWHYNYKPQVVFRRGKGNCGGTAGLIAGLLEGDYDEVGMINLRFPNDGHVINWIRDGNQYYVFDGIGWVGSGFQSGGLSFSIGKTLEEAALIYGRLNNTRSMAAYTNSKGGDCPVMFCGNASKMPSNYCGEIKILQETPDEGFTYILVESEPEILQGIDVIRGVW